MTHQEKAFEPMGINPMKKMPQMSVGRIKKTFMDYMGSTSTMNVFDLHSIRSICCSITCLSMKVRDVFKANLLALKDFLQTILRDIFYSYECFNAYFWWSYRCASVVVGCLKHTFNTSCWFFWLSSGIFFASLQLAITILLTIFWLQFDTLKS